MYRIKNKTEQNRNDDEKYSQTGIQVTVTIHTNHDSVRASVIMLSSNVSSSSWQSPVITVKQGSEITLLPFSLHFFCALASPYMLYNRTEHSQGFSIC